MIECIISSSVLIAVVIALRSLFQGKISRRLQYALWGLVLLRLLLPFSLFQSPLSVMNAVDAEGITDSLSGIQVYSDMIRNTGLSPDEAREVGNGTLHEIQGTPVESGNAQLRSYIFTDSLDVVLGRVLRIVWMTGSLLLGVWFIGVNAAFGRRLYRTRKPVHDTGCTLPVYVTEAIASPCLFGLRPSVYLTPKALESEESTRYVLAHEFCHHRHGDTVWSVLRSLCLAAYWWNPLVWAAAILSRADSELACDEAVIRRIGEDRRMDYGRALIDMIAVKPAPSGLLCAATTMTSGKRGVRRRLELIVRYPKTAIPVLAAALLIVAVAVGCTFTGAGTGGASPLEAKIEAGLSDPDPLVRQAWTMIRSDIESHEETSRDIFGDEGTIFTDAELTKLELTDSFDRIYEGAVIEVYALNYRMLPEDPSKIMLAGGMDMRDGWLLERGSMGSSYLVAKSTGDERTYLGTIWPDGEGQGALDSTYELLYRLEAENGSPAARSPIEIGRVFTVKGSLPPEEAAELLTLRFMESLQESEDLENPRYKTFVVTEYKDLRFELYPTADAPEEYDLREWEIGDNAWVVEPSAAYRFEGVISPIGDGGGIPAGEWVTELYQGSRVGFLMVRDGDFYTFRSRLYTGNESGGMSTVGGAGRSVSVSASLPLADYVKTAVQMNYRHMGWDSYTQDKETIGFVADAMIGALPEKLDQTASEIDNDSMARDYWEQGSCIELVFDGGAELSYTLLGDIRRSYQCDRMLVCFSKSEDILFLSKDGAYTHTIGPLDTTALAPISDWLRAGMEVVNFSDGFVEILGQKLRYENVDLESLRSKYSMAQIESAMSHSVAFYQAAQLRQFDLIDALATDGLKAEIAKWGNNSTSKASDLMQLSNITDVAFPVSVTAPAFSAADSGRLSVSLGLDEKTTAVIELIKSRDGSVLVDSFKVLAD